MFYGEKKFMSEGNYVLCIKIIVFNVLSPNTPVVVSAGMAYPVVMSLEFEILVRVLMGCF